MRHFPSRCLGQCLPLSMGIKKRPDCNHSRALVVLPRIPRHAGPFAAGCLSLGVLGTLARLAQANLLALDLTRIPGHVTSAAQRRAQGLVVFHQGAGNTVPDGAGLAEAAAAMNCDVYVKFVFQINKFKRLPHYHAGHFATEVHIQRAMVNGNITGAILDLDTSRGGLAAAGSVILGC